MDFKYYKDKETGKHVNAYPIDGSQDQDIPENFVKISVQKANTILLENAPVISPETLAAKAKAEKQLALDNIIVTTASGKEFDGNETARGDMVSAITIAGFSGQISTEWKLADNSVDIVTLDELKEALALALAEKGRIVGAIS